MNALHHVLSYQSCPVSSDIICSFNVPSSAKYPLPPKMADFAKRISGVIYRFMVCYLRLPQIKDLPSIIGCEPIRSFKKLYPQNLPPLGLRQGYFVAVGTLPEVTELFCNELLYCSIVNSSIGFDRQTHATAAALSLS